MVSVKAIQIIVPVKHKLQLQLEHFVEILEAENIKDRNVAIISIAGAFRKGKSFLLNFFLKYLYAQYKKHDVTDWIGEGRNGGELHGFKSRGGRKPETTGIWMWSEIFTHDYENGEKVAIILLDTQGIFDNQSSMKDCSATFAISMMLASVQCYNISQNIQEDDLQHLELFTEYGRLALEQSKKIPFQKLLFIVRDWQYEDEIAYGYAKSLVDEVLEQNDEQESEHHQLRRRIKSCFEQIDAFVMPHPGFIVAEAKEFNGDLSTINPKFIHYLKVLVPSIFAPEKLILKQIGGRKVRAHELVHYLETFVEIFNGNELPAPSTVLMSTATTNNLILFTNCLNSYIETMEKNIEEKSLDQDKPYFEPTELQEIHDMSREDAALQFTMKPKLGGDEIFGHFLRELNSEIRAKYKKFQQENEKKQKNFFTIAKFELQRLYSDCYHLYVDSMQKSVDVDEYLSDIDLKTRHENALSGSLSKFEETRKRGGDEMIEMYTNMLLNQIQMKCIHFEMDNDWKRTLIQDLKNKSEEAAARARIEAKAEAAEKAATEAKADLKNKKLYDECIAKHKNILQKSMTECEKFYEPKELTQIHVNAKRNAMAQFEQNRVDGGREIMLEVQLAIDIETNFIYFEQQNDRKQKECEKENMINELKRRLDKLRCTIM